MRNLWISTLLTLLVIPVGPVSAAGDSAPASQEAVRENAAPPASPGEAGYTPPLTRFKVTLPERGAPAANLRFELAEPQYVTLQIYDESGHLVRGLLEGERPAGFQTVAWNGRDRSGNDLDPGTYYALLGVAGRYEVRPVALDQRSVSR